MKLNFGYGFITKFKIKEVHHKIGQKCCQQPSIEFDWLFAINFETSWMPLVKSFARTGSFEAQKNETFAFIPEFQTFPHFSLTTHLEALKV